MRYLLMISAQETPAEEDTAEPDLTAFHAWLGDLIERGVLRAHEGLRPSRTATTVRVRGDDVLLTDGPYIEAKDQIGGFALIDVQDLDEAIEIAATHPACAFGQVEIRPIREP
ncbi:YciI family protein [Nocardia sp. BMG111209]|uniref:YciI family protein n=1 Tax=Nocardia sp. BMG111209 TaxID=1160137 RepID=UPI000382209B|nr:YciI family protein [Nocardia sp. BMG111209]